MAQSKLNDLAGKFGKGGPPGLGIGLKLLGVAGALVYGASQSVYTGICFFLFGVPSNLVNVQIQGIHIDEIKQKLNHNLTSVARV